ncbi:MAG: MoaD family protein [Candidatus Bathyarchaeota archaeon]
MNIEIKFFTSLREITRKKMISLQLNDVISVDELISLLIKKYGKDFKEYVYTDQGKVQDFLSFLINGQNINNLEGFSTLLKDGDVIAILPPVGGG